jgi:hypothetical protein
MVASPMMANVMPGQMIPQMMPNVMHGQMIPQMMPNQIMPEQYINLAAQHTPIAMNNML